jgi:hypothetical protein
MYQLSRIAESLFTTRYSDEGIDFVAHLLWIASYVEMTEIL